MPGSYTYADVLSIAKPQIVHRGDDTLSASLCNMATEQVWDAYDWHETVREGAPFYLLPGVQDYPVPIASVPSDFSGFRRVVLTDIDSGHPEVLVSSGLSHLRSIDKTNATGLPGSISFLPERRAFRVHPRPGPSISPTRYKVEYSYKSSWPRVLPDNLHIPLPLPDTFLPCFVLGVLWASARLTGQATARELYQDLVAELSRKAADQGLADGDSYVYPSEPLGGWDAYY